MMGPLYRMRPDASSVTVYNTMEDEMNIVEFRELDDRYIPGTTVGIYKARRFENKNDAAAITKTWDDADDWSIEPIEDNLGRLCFYVVAFKDCDDGGIIGFL